MKSKADKQACLSSIKKETDIHLILEAFIEIL
jgi:hypothetical protein